MEEKLSIINQTKSKLPFLPISEIKNKKLGKKYSLSVAFVSEKTSRELNKKYRNKDKSTNVLSFSLRENEGELVLCTTVIKKQAPDFDKNFKDFLIFLIIHGMLHLKGLDHSPEMEKLEEKYLSYF